MPGFDWQTEKYQLWKDLPLVEDSNEPKGRHRLAGLILILTLGLAGSAVYWLANHSVNNATIRAQRSLLSSFSLVRRAVADPDEELFALLLADDDATWVSGQKALLARGLVLDRRPLGLQLQTAEPSLVEIKFSPDLEAARILFEQAYLFHTNNGRTETVVLQQTAVFRFDGRRWLLAPPDAGFWGDQLTTSGDFLTIVYPERDGAIVNRLARDLDRQLADMCATLAGIDCPARLRIQLRLEKHPASLAEMDDRERVLTNSQDIVLPSPTLVGTPVDETGYQALYRGYASQVVAAVITSLVDWQCCRQAAFYRALLDKQLSQLALQPWPLTTVDYETMWSRYFRIDDIDALWRSSSVELTEDERWQVVTFIDFLAEVGTDASVIQLLRQLPQTPSFRGWISQFTKETFSTEIELKMGWLRFAYEQTPSAQQSPPIPLPQDTQLFCLSGLDRKLYRYDLVTDTWSGQRSLDDSVTGLVSSLPGKDGIILQERQLSGLNQSQVWTILQNGAETSIPVMALGSIFYPVSSGAESLGQSLLTVSYGPGQKLGQFTLLDLDSCDAADCDSISFPGLPVWSPDGTQTIVSVADGNGSFRLTLADGEGRPLRPIGTGFSPFWLGDETYGYTRVVDDVVEVVIATIASGEPLMRLTGEDLIAALPEDERPHALSVGQVHGSPANSRLLFIEAAAPSLQSRYIFSFNRESKEVALNLQLDDTYRPVSFDFSPDGRWWTLSTHADPGVGPEWTLYLHDIGNNQTTLLAFNPIPYVGHSYDWSKDGRWLLKVDSGTISLIAPAYDYQELILIDPSMCTSAVWVHEQ